MDVTSHLYRRGRIKNRVAIGRECTHVLAIVDFDDMFRYMCSSWEGSAHDSRVLKSCLEGPHTDFPLPPNS